jgi:hypothetical protein
MRSERQLARLGIVKTLPEKHLRARAARIIKQSSTNIKTFDVDGESL